MTNKKGFLFLISIIFVGISGCNQKPNCQIEIKDIKVSFIKGYLERSSKIDCSAFPDGIAPNRIIDSTITNEDALDEIINHLRDLKSIDGYSSPDVRIKCIIEFSNKKTKILCLGDLGGIMYDGKVMEDNFEMAFLIKKNSGYYNYFPRKYLPLFSELKDSSRLNEIIIKNILPSEQLHRVESDTGLVEISF